MKNAPPGLPAMIRHARTAAGMTQAALAAAAGCPQGHLSDLETGRACPTVATLEKIAAAVGCHLVVEFAAKDRSTVTGQRGRRRKRRAVDRRTASKGPTPPRRRPTPPRR